MGRTRYGGMYRYFYPPRIGIDFFANCESGYNFIPNLDLGDVARVTRVLELIQQDTVFEKLGTGKIKPFEIGLSFENELKRKITLDAESSDLVISYRGLHRGKPVEFDYTVSREGAERLISALKNLVAEYQKVILKYVMTGEVDEEFR